jgi:alkanesulfonate monooxygenase SsuD/methylene tetrahydromethanopterin reductase-like flavin-dependent oxidoreductase (luciferase family)
MEEAVTIIKRLFAGETVTEAGRYYRLRSARLSPRPVQQPRPPILLGGGGPRMLRIAAREADIVGFVPQFSAAGRPIIRQATEAALADKVALVRRAAGDRFDTLELNVFIALAGMIGSGTGPLPSAFAAGLAAGTGVVRSPYLLHGTRSRLRDLLERRRDRLGISYYSIPQQAMESMAPLVEDLAGR